MYPDPCLPLRYDELSGGQRVKMELIRRVFSTECPAVLLLDEVFSPLDPASKRLVQEQIAAHCSGSVVVVIYHTDVNDATSSQHARKEFSGGGASDLQTGADDVGVARTYVPTVESSFDSCGSVSPHLSPDSLS